MQTGINVGTTIEKESIDTVTDALIRLMETNADQETIRQAIGTLGQMASVNGLTIQNCIVKGDRTVTINTNDDDLDE